MSYTTKIVVFCGTSDSEGIERVEKALHDFADDNNGRACAFERMAHTGFSFASDGHGTTFVGAANYLDEDAFTEALRKAADTGWGHFDPLTIILRGDEEHLRQRVRLLDDSGEWTRV